MAVDLNEVKINVRSLLTSSQKPLSILQLQKDYREQEGCNIPYRSLGFSSVIELLQSMTDVLTVPPNPNESTTLSLVVGDKTNHLRMLVIKQRSNTKKKKAKPNMKRRYGHQISYNGNKTFSGHNSYNKNILTKTNNYASNISQNSRSGFHKTNNSSKSYNQINQSSSTSKSYSDLNRNDFNQNPNSSIGYMTDKLRSDIERFILENQKLISIYKLKEIVKQHPDYSILKVNSMQDLKDRVKDFLNINDTSVSLKNTLQSKTSIASLHHNTDVQIKPSRLSDVNKSSYNNSPPSISAINHINGEDKNVINSKKYEYNEQNIVSDLFKRLKVNGFQEDTPHNKNLNDNNFGINSKINSSIESSTDYIDICKNQSMVRELGDGFYNTDKNSDIAKINLRKSIEYVKKLSENRKKKYAGTEFVNGKKPESCSIAINDENSITNLNSYLHSTPKKNNNDNITLDEDQCIPEGVRLNIARIFKVYCYGVNIENFKLIYTKLYCTIFDPIFFGFTSIKQLFKVLDQMIEIRNNVLYPKNEFKLYENMDFKNENDCLLSNICLNNEVKISTNIEQPLLSFNQDNSLKKMLLVETYNPSLFYLQLCYKIVELDRLMMQMQQFYETENKNYFVKTEQILPGSFYASSYTSFSNLKQWYRVRVLREVNPTTVEVIHVDYGTIDNIPKNKLRFLKCEFCNLPCQAIHCCLTGYNELDSISPEVTNAFLEIININKEVLVMVDAYFILNKHCQIVHVTLFQNDSKKLENINNELTIWHLKR
uniref:Tudor domain-containing protein 5 n=1 Tax=Schizaphis graminum TaxID=13262 RepID=A0A2S2N8T3_SCHGA